jgi:CheY-like chemotaxis protein
MPKLTGVELARALRERLTADCPRIVLITGSELRRVELTLFDHVARKPFRFAAVLEKVQSFLAPRKVRRPRSHTRLRQLNGNARSGGERG